MCTHVVALKFRRLTSLQHAGGWAFLRGLCVGKKKHKLVSATTISTNLICHQLCLLCLGSAVFSPQICRQLVMVTTVIPLQWCLCLTSSPKGQFCIRHCLWLLMSRVLNLVCWQYGGGGTWCGIMRTCLSKYAYWFPTFELAFLWIYSAHFFNCSAYPHAHTYRNCPKSYMVKFFYEYVCV